MVDRRSPPIRPSLGLFTYCTLTHFLAYWSPSCSVCERLNGIPAGLQNRLSGLCCMVHDQQQDACNDQRGNRIVRRGQETGSVNVSKQRVADWAEPEPRWKAWLVSEVFASIQGSLGILSKSRQSQSVEMAIRQSCAPRFLGMPRSRPDTALISGVGC